MPREVGQRARRAVRAQVGGAGDVAHAQEAQRARDEVGVDQRAHAQHAVEALVHEVDAAVGGADADLQQRMRGQELGQPRQHEVARERVGQVDAQPAAEPAGRRLEHRLQLLGLGQQLLAAIEEALAVGRHAHAARGALQEPRAQLRLELLHGRRHASLGQPELFGGAAEARELGHGGEDAQFVQVHDGDCSVRRNSVALDADFIRQAEIPKVPPSIHPRSTDMTMTPTIALVTGGSRGLGRSAVLKLAERGVDAILTYKSNEAEAQAVVRQVEALGRKAVALQLDAGDSKSFAAFAQRVKAALSATWQRSDFDYLVNNAGMGVAHASVAETTEEDFDLLFNVHLKGTFFLTQKLLPLIKDGGRILNTSSGLARFALPGYAAYAAMKGGVEVLTRYLAKELGPRGIAVNTIAPGAIATDFGGGRVRDNAQLNAFVASQTALGRAGLPDDIGNAVAALLTDPSGWINAQRIEVSGGMFI